MYINLENLTPDLKFPVGGTTCCDLQIVPIHTNVSDFCCQSNSKHTTFTTEIVFKVFNLLDIYVQYTQHGYMYKWQIYNKVPIIICIADGCYS